MKPKIGICTKTFGTIGWYKEAPKTGFRVLEINRRESALVFSKTRIEKAKSFLKGFDLSVHSGSFQLFNEENEQFTSTALQTITSEVLLCGMLGAKELILHLTSQKLNDAQAARLRDLLDFANEHNVEIIYESNAYPMDGKVALDVLGRFPDLNYNLDFGHLNKGLHDGGLGMELDEFLDKVRDRVVYVHAHNNHGGKVDEHNALRDGTLDWKHVLDALDMSTVRKIIMEMRGMDNINKTKEDLDAYFTQRKN